MSTYNNYTFSTSTVDDSSYIKTAADTSYKISAECIDEDELKKIVTRILLEDPNSDVRRLAEDYLIQCVRNATEDPENNPVLQRLFERGQNEYAQVLNEIMSIRVELNNLKRTLGIYSNDPSGELPPLQYQVDLLEDKLNTLVENLGKAGICVNYWKE